MLCSFDIEKVQWNQLGTFIGGPSFGFVFFSVCGSDRDVIHSERGDESVSRVSIMKKKRFEWAEDAIAQGRASWMNIRGIVHRLTAKALIISAFACWANQRNLNAFILCISDIISCFLEISSYSWHYLEMRSFSKENKTLYSRVY